LLLTLIRLLKGYGSCFAPAGTVYLTTQKRLLKEHCSSIARFYFNQIYYLKEKLVFVSLRLTKDLSLVSAVIKTWLFRIWQVLNKSSVKKNKNQLFHNLVQRLRNTHNKLLELILLVLKS
jgi:hypothetical protein